MIRPSELSELQQAVQAALDDDWEGAHGIAQDSDHPLARWIHAVLHKIEGDAGNSRYWYARAGRSYEEYTDTKAELMAVKVAIQATIQAQQA